MRKRKTALKFCLEYHVMRYDRVSPAKSVWSSHSKNEATNEAIKRERAEPSLRFYISRH